MSTLSVFAAVVIVSAIWFMVSGNSSVRSTSRRRASIPVRYRDVGQLERRRVRRRISQAVVPWECFNCHRRNVNLTRCERGGVRSRRAHCTFSITSIAVGGSCLLCDECREYLTRETQHHVTDDWRCIWPSFMWKFLSDASDDSVVARCGVRGAWHFVPLGWRQWWLNSLVELQPTKWALPGVRLDDVVPHFVDATSDLNKFENMLDKLELGNIRQVCNLLNFPTVLCPWGCSTFLQDVGGLDMGSVFHHVLRKERVKLRLPTVSRKDIKNCLSIRPDFLDPRHARHLLCPAFEVRPSLALHRKKGMCVLTCACHSGGTVHRYYHVPRTPFGLMSAAGDQLAHCVVHHRDIKPMSPKRFNNTYQLFMQCGSFSGIGMSCLKTNGNFSMKSEMLAHSESLSIACRDDIKGLLGRLEEDGHIHPDTAAKFRETSGRMHPDGGSYARKKYASGATYTLYTDCMRMQRELATVHQVTVACNNGDDDTVYRTFTPIWLRSIVWVHSVDDHGALFHPIKRLFSTPIVGRSAVLYVLLGAVTTQPCMWDVFTGAIQDENDWIGQFLVFATRVFPYGGSRPGVKTDPFKNAKKKDSASIAALLGQGDDLASILRSAVAPFGVACWTRPWRFDVSEHDGLPFGICGVKSTDCMFVCSRRCIHVTPVDVDLPVSFLARDDLAAQFELRYFACEQLNCPSRLFARHGGPFQAWYTTTTYEEEYLYSDNTEFAQHSRSWTFAVYVNTRPPDVEQLRRDFLSYTGGQSVVECDVHQLPLIVAGTKSFKDNERCPGLPSADGCGKKLYYKCPRKGCRVCLCRSCLRSIPEHLPIRVVCGAVLITGVANVSDNADEDDDNLDSNISSGSFDFGEVDEDAVVDEDVVGVDHEGEEGEEDNRLFGMPLVQGLHDGTDEPLFDPEAGDCSAELLCPDLPQTIAHVNSIPDLVHDSESNFVGNVCVLNGLGSLLVRSRHDLNLARANLEFLQERIVSRYGYSIPMLYAEAALFSSVFPFDDGCTTSILGAMPSALLSQNKNSNEHGIASLKNHVRNRVQLTDSASGVDYRYHTYMFDSLLNKTLSSEDSRVILNRGVAASNTPAGLKVREKDDHFFSDSIDNRQNVLNLTESQKYYRSNWFITITANQKLTFGLAPIKAWIDGDDWIVEVEKVVGHKLSASEVREYRQAVHNSSCTLMTRCWLKVRYIIMAYIMDSLEQPFGNLLTLFWRDEYQDGEGNLSHIHGLAQAIVGSLEELRLLRDKIRGFNADIVRIEEVDDFVRRGIYDKHSDWYQMSEEARTILTHRNERSKKRTGTGDEEVESRYVDPVHITPNCTQHVSVRVDPGHTPEVVAILARCGLCTPPPEYNPALFEGEHELLRCTRHLPPVRMGEHNMSPVQGAIFASMRSMSNAQVVSGYTIARYVTKYLIKVDKNSHTVCRVSSHDETRVKARHNFLYNTKIAVSGANEAKRINNNKRERQHPNGRVIARPEIVQLLVGDPQVHHNMDFVKVATTPLEDRAGFRKKKDTDRLEPDNDDVLRHYRSLAGDNSLSFVVYPDYVRRMEGLPEWRQFTANQLLVINDHFDSEVTVSKATVFDVRPPELRELFPCLLSYYRWFNRTKMYSTKHDDELSAVTSQNLRDSWWIDGFGFTVQVHGNAIDELRAYLANVDVFLLRRPDQSIIDLFSDILQGEASSDWLALKKRFIAPKKTCESVWAKNRALLPVPVHSFVKPTNATKFLFHVLLSLGQFQTEFDLVSHATMRDAFVYANLINNSSPEALASSLTLLIRRYVVEQLAYYPVGTRTWDNYLVSATKVFEDAILHGTVSISEMPACLNASLLGEVDCKVKKRLSSLREATLRAAYKELSVSIALMPEAPTLNEIITGVRVFEGKLPISPGQSIESYDEQEHVRALLHCTLNDYMDPARTTMARSAMVAGGPGNGKTHSLMYSTLIFYASGKIIVPCAILADRARAIGGEHFHMLFCFPTCMATAQRLAELAVVHILRKPDSVELLLRIDGLALDESGTMSASIFAALDIIMRRVRGSSTWMGGMVIVTTIDDKQLKPVNGYPLLLSPHILTCFRVAILRHSVRSSADINQQRVINISRIPERELNADEGLIDEVVKLVSRNCRFVSDWDDPAIDEKTLRVFAKKQPVIRAVGQFYDKIEAEFAAGISGFSLLTRRNAEDVENAIESHGNYRQASPSVSAMLDKDTKEARRLLFFPFAVYLFTYNDPGHAFTQSRLAILYDVPSQLDLDAFQPIYLYAAPPGVRSAPAEFQTKQQLLDSGWTRVRLLTAPDRKQTYTRLGVRAKRKQYGIRPFISATIHCVQGATLYALATSIEVHKSDFRLWEKALWLVLISRTRRLSDVIFVGDKQRNLDMIRRVLSIRSQFSEYTDRVLSVAAGETRTDITLSHHLHPYRPRDNRLPYNGIGFVYLIVTARSWVVTYIGQTEDLYRRLRDHNSGQGARETRGKGPWLLVAYVEGFGSNATARRHFEDDWQESNKYRFTQARQQGTVPSTSLMLNAAEDLIAAAGENGSLRAYSGLTLKLVQHADLVHA